MSQEPMFSPPLTPSGRSATFRPAGNGMGTSQKIPLAVECYAGYRADERPTALTLGSRRIAVREILDRWLGEDHAYFKIVGEDGAVYLIRQDLNQSGWELILFEVPARIIHERTVNNSG